MIALALMLTLTQATPAQPPTPNRSRFENVATPEEDVPIGSRVQRRSEYVTADERDAAWTMHRFAECLVRTREQQMIELLSTGLNSPEQNRIVRDVIGWRSRCLRARSMQIDHVLLRGAVAEALFRQELRGRQIGPPDRAPELLDADPARNSSAALERFGRCMVSRHPDSVRALIGTRPGSRSGVARGKGGDAGHHRRAAGLPSHIAAPGASPAAAARRRCGSLLPAAPRAAGGRRRHRG
jgi:hypothetical protein